MAKKLSIIPGEPFEKISAMQPGDWMEFAPGEHVVNVPAKACAAVLSDGVRLFGGPEATITVVGDGTCFAAVNRSDIWIDGLNIRHRPSTPVANYSSSLVFRGCRGTRVERSQFVNCGSSALKFGRSAGHQLGRYFDNLGEGFGPCRDVFIYKCVFTNCIGPVIGFKPGGAQHVIIVDNVFTGYATYAISAEGEDDPHGLITDVRITDNTISGGNTKLRGGTVGPIFGAYVGEQCRNIFIARNQITTLGGVGATLVGGICVSTSPSQGDMPVSDVQIEENSIIDVQVSGLTAPILLVTGKASIRGLRIANNNIPAALKARLLKPAADKTSGSVYNVRSDVKIEGLT